MDVRITPGILSGNIDIIESKSHAHRILICTALSDRPTKVICAQSSEDIDATVRCLNALGANIARTSDGFSVVPIATPPESAYMDCGESGSTLRFLLPVIGALGVHASVKMSGRLPQRPLSPLWEQLCAGGMTLDKPQEDIIECGGKLCAGTYTLPGNISSQFISGLLFALPVIDGQSQLIITGKTESKAYIEMTTRVLSGFGIDIPFECDRFIINGGCTPRTAADTVKAEGDWSNAAFWLCAGALSDSGITCRGLDLVSVQGDRHVTTLLDRFGAKVKLAGDYANVTCAGMNGCVIDASDIPDLVPILAVCACRARGITKIINAQRLRIKESDRLKTVSDMLSALGADIAETDDGLIINGSEKGLRGGAEVCACGDHRIAMSAAIASCMCREAIVITGAQAVNKSYPKFWEHFEMLGGKAEVI
ncbi:MAG: 3-phosphoshikimate 1-carboxyvinyltransferase [Clostridia bacterium]|nr:3-phosphoshikimate 1-carboxyvinyltransferase [Clostridia bacterium]